MSASPMTLREAVRFIRSSEHIPGCRIHPDYCECDLVRVRAEAIIDAAVQAHEATVALESDIEDRTTLHRCGAAYMKLRAMERGEASK